LAFFAKVKMIPRSICYLLCIISTPSIGTSNREYRLKRPGLTPSRVGSDSASSYNNKES
jgi:hypothetical protein